MRGKTNYIERQYSKAVDDFETVVKGNPKYNLIYINLANAHFETNNYPSAILNYSKALDSEPNLLDAYFKRAVSYMKTNNYRPAIDDFTKLISEKYKNAALNYWLGCAYLSIGDDDTAIANFTKSIQQGINTADAYYYRAVAYYRNDNNKNALANLSEAIRLSPSNQNAVALRNKINSYGPAPSYRLFASQYSNEFSGNPAVAKNRYNGKYIAISGTINKKGADSGGATLGGAIIGGLLFGPLGALLGAGAGASTKDLMVVNVNGVSCYFSDARNNEYARLSENQNITLIGKCDGSSSLNNCYILNSLEIL
jgi:tetratricopeptide (TPR) repeat protein